MNEDEVVHILPSAANEDELYIDIYHKLLTDEIDSEPFPVFGNRKVTNLDEYRKRK